MPTTSSKPKPKTSPKTRAPKKPREDTKQADSAMFSIKVNHDTPSLIEAIGMNETDFRKLINEKRKGANGKRRSHVLEAIMTDMETNEETRTLAALTLCWMIVG